VLPPAFIVCDSTNYYNPLVYKLSENSLKEAYEGFTYKNRTYPGVKQLIGDLKWAIVNNVWNVSKENYLNNGIVELKCQ